MEDREYDYDNVTPQIPSQFNGFIVSSAQNFTGTIGTDRTDTKIYRKYSELDLDKLIMLLTLWIDNIEIRDKLEEMYKLWKELQKQNEFN